jgi:lipopolysaccharide transport system permease protein
MFGVVLQLWFWLTPIVYAPAILGERMQAALRWNPMVPVVEAYQGIFLHARAPDPGALLPIAALAAALCVLAGFLYRRVAGELADEL